MKTLARFGMILFLVVGLQAQTPDSEALESQIVGVELKRGDGTFMGLAVEGNSLTLRFYDEEKQLIDPPIARATAWWKPRNKSGRERVVLNAAGTSLKSPPRVRPPLVFSVMLTLLDANGKAAGSHRFNLADLQKAETAKKPASRY